MGMDVSENRDSCHILSIKLGYPGLRPKYCEN